MLNNLKFSIIDIYRGTHIIRDFYNIQKEISNGYEYLKNIQKKKISAILLHAKEYVDFYKDKLKKINNNDIISYPTNVLLELPYITKDELRREQKSFVSSKKIRHIKNITGGTDGQPLSFLVDIDCVSRTKAFDLYFWNQAFNYNFSDRVLMIGGSSLSGDQSFRVKVYNYLHSRIFMEGGTITPELIIKNVKILCEGKYDVIYSYPSSLMLYVSKAIEMGLDFKGKLKGITTTSENLHRNTRIQLEDFFKTDVFDVYGARDGGIVADECKLKNGFHYNMQDCYVEEFINSNEGDIPELVLTNLVSFSMPFIRYRIGDCGILHDDKCSCGSPLPMIKSLLGRSRDIIKLPNSKILHGVIFNKLISHYPSINQYQIIVKKDYLKIIIKTKDEFSNENKLKLLKEISELINNSLKVEIDTSANFIYTKANKLKVIVNQL